MKNFFKKNPAREEFARNFFKNTPRERTFAVVSITMFIAAITWFVLRVANPTTLGENLQQLIGWSFAGSLAYWALIWFSAGAYNFFRNFERHEGDDFAGFIYTLMLNVLLIVFLIGRFFYFLFF